MASDSNDSEDPQWVLDSEEELRDPKFLTLQLKVCCLGVLCFEGNDNNIDDGNLKALLVHIRTVFQDLEALGVLLDGHLWMEESDDPCSSILERLELLNPDIQQVYNIISKSSRFITGTSHETVLENLDHLLSYVEDLTSFKSELIAPLEEELEAAQTSLRFLRHFLGFTAKRCNQLEKLKDLVNHAEFLMRNMSCLFYLCSVSGKMNDRMVNEMKMHLAFELQRFSPAQTEVREMYIKALKASKSGQGDSTMVNEFDLDFFDSLRGHILDLSDTKLSFTDFDRDQIISLHRELRILIMSSYKPPCGRRNPCLYIEVGSSDLDQISDFLLESISAVIIDMGCLIYTLYNNEQNTEEAKMEVSSLQDIIKIAKEDSRKAYDTCIPKSWHLKTKFPTTNVQLKTKFPTTNAQDMMHSLMTILEKIRSHSSGWGYIPCHLSEVLQKEMHSLIAAFSNLTSTQHLEHGELEIQMSRLNDIRNETESLISSFLRKSPPDWNQNLCLLVLIEVIKMLKKEFKYLQNQMMHDTSTSKSHKKMIPQGKKTVIDYPVMSEDEAEKIGGQMINRSKRSHIFSINAGMHGIEDQMRWLESNLDLICPLKNEVKELRIRVSFLKVFLSFKGKWHVDDGNLKVLLTRIRTVFQNANQDIQRLWADMIQISPEKEWCLPLNMDCILSSVIARLQLLKPDFQEVYTILSKSSRFITGLSEEAAMENLNSLQKNIEDLLRYNAELGGCVKEQLEVVRHSLRFLRNLLGFTAKRCSKLGKLKDLLIHAEFLADSMSCLLYLCNVDDKMNDWMANELKMHLLSELQKFSSTQPHVREIYIRALKASSSAEANSTVIDEFDLGFVDSLRDYVLELSNTNLSFITSNKDKILSLLDMLEFLLTFFAMDRSLDQHSEHDQMFNYLFERINAVIIDIGCVIYSLNDDEENENVARELELNKKISDLEAVISVTKEDTRKMYDLFVPKLLRSNFPRTNGQGFIGSLFRNLEELLNTKADLVAPLKHHIEIVQKELLSLREDFSKISKQRNLCEELQSQWTHFLDVAYQTEYVIDSFLGGDRPLYCHKLGIFNVIEDIKAIKIELKGMENKMTDDTSLHKASCFSTQILVESKNNAVMSSEERPADEKSTTKLVILREEEEKIIEQLTTGSKKLHIISIVGMPGIGKTTLADSVFLHPSVTRHFHVRASCSVSQVHYQRRLLRQILRQVPAGSKQYTDDDDLDQKLYQSLKGRRYLILLDDLWGILPWESMKVSLPDDENGSRIIFTSRFDDIAAQAGLENISFRLSPLPEEKSWEMLQVKLFGNKSCPPELASVGYEIAANCKGLPLTIDLIAGVLRMKERKEWKIVAESLMTTLFEDPQGRCWKVLELSYQNLPDNLKPCFLYFAAFPEDANVPTRDLIMLWIAEGFVELEKGETRILEDVSRDILNNLIRRSLVTVSKRGPLGGVVVSRVHDLLREFVVAKAQEESFMLKIDGEAKFHILSSPDVHDLWREQYRLCICPNYWRQLYESDSSGTRTRALISSYVSWALISSYGSWHDFSLNFRTFKLLRVLYIPNAPCGYCPEMFTLIHLRLLAISRWETAADCKIISNIHKLWNLETFIMYGGYIEADENLLLDKICNMVRLRHFCIEDYIHFRYLREEIWQKASFANLQTLHNLKASYEEDIEKILKLMPNLVELKVLFYNPDGGCYPFPKLDFLKKLESLEVIHQNHCDLPYPCKIISFPPHLKRLVLSSFGVPWSEISEIEYLEYLEVLELKKGAFIGPIWDMIDGQFPKLKYLSLSCLDIEEWNATEDHLSCLEQLQVERCTKLKELPSCLAEIATIQTIKLFNCTEAADNSAKRIKEEQEEMGNEQFVVNITFYEDF